MTTRKTRALFSALLPILAFAGIAFSEGEIPVLEDNAMQLASGLAANYPDDIGIVDDPAVIFASSFENGIDDWTAFRNRDAMDLVQDSDLANTGQSCLKITAIRDQDTGGSIGYKWADGVDRLHVRFYCRFHPDTVKPHHFVNMGADSPEWNTGGHAGQRRQGHLTYSTTIEPPNLEEIGRAHV